MSTWMLLSWIEAMSWTVSNSWVSQLCLLRNPCWKGKSIEWESRWSLTWEQMMCSMIFDIIQVTEANRPVVPCVAFRPLLEDGVDPLLAPDWGDLTWWQRLFFFFFFFVNTKINKTIQIQHTQQCFDTMPTNKDLLHVQPNVCASNLLRRTTQYHIDVTFILPYSFHFNCDYPCEIHVIAFHTWRVISSHDDHHTYIC